MSVWACADLHGQGQLFKQILNYIKPDDIVYFLGDAIDRGPNGWEIAKTILNDKRFVYLMGNHEDMMIKGLGQFPYDDYEAKEYWWNSHMNLWFHNGGESTYSSILTDPEAEIYIEKIKHLPLTVLYINKNNQKIYLSHSGKDPNFYDYVINDDILWDRTHFLDDKWYGADDEYIIHGHTPILYLIEEIKAYNGIIDYNTDKDDIPFWYANRHKCCIDCGAHFTNTIVLLNLDTFEEVVFNG